MKLYLIPDFFRIEGKTGKAAEQSFQHLPVKQEKTISLISARNQMVSFQLVAELENEMEEFTKFAVTGTALQGVRGEIPADYEFFIEWYHAINGQLIPDLLIPLQESKIPFSIPLDKTYHQEQKAGALWVDLWVPEEVKQGQYAGRLDVSVNGTDFVFGIDLLVKNCTVPSESMITADLNNYADTISLGYPHLKNNKNRYRDGSYLEVERDFYRISREHRALFQNLNYQHSGVPVESFAPELTGSGKNKRVKSWEAFDRHFGPYLDGSAFQGSRRGAFPIEFMFTPFNLGWPASFSKFGKKGYKTEFRRILWEYMKHFEEKGWTKTVLEIMFNHKKDYRFFSSTQDEIWYEHDEEVLDYMIDVMRDTYQHSSAKFVFRADSSNHYGNHYGDKYGDAFEMWVVASTMFSWFPESVREMHDRKSVLWIYGWYNECMPIDLPLHASLTHPVICFMTGATGFCSFWNAVTWGEDYLATPFMNGGQTLFYPGGNLSESNVLPSIRLKVLRNHMQLIDLMMMEKGLSDEADRLTCRELEQIINDCYGYADSNAWWSPKPDFLEVSPRYWNLDTVARNNHYGRHSPLIIEKLRQKVLQQLG